MDSAQFRMYMRDPTDEALLARLESRLAGSPAIRVARRHDVVVFSAPIERVVLIARVERAIDAELGGSRTFI
jgi:hypothetical protein